MKCKSKCISNLEKSYSNMQVGNIELFDPTTGNWKLYTERLEQYFLINDTKEHLKVPTLIALMGGTSYELLVALCAPQKPSTLTYKDVVKTMSDYFYPKPCILAERYKFRQRKQNNRETILEYASDLKKLAMKCEFNTSFDENLRDQLVYGIHSEATRKQLFAEDTLDFRTALAIAHSSEGTNGDRNNDNEVQMSISEFKDPIAITFMIEASEENTKLNCNDEIPLCDFKSDLVISHRLDKSAETIVDSNNDSKLEISSDSKNDWPIEFALEASGKQSSKFYDVDEVPMSNTKKSGSEDEGMPKKKQRKNKHWLCVSKFINLKKAEEFLESEKSWGRYWMHFTKDGIKRYYRCNKVKRRGPQCAAERYLLLDKYSDSIFLYSTDADHNHDEIGTRADVGIADLTKVMINSLFDQRLKPNAILKSLREMEGVKVPKKSKLMYYLSRLKHSKIENAPSSK